MHTKLRVALATVGLTAFIVVSAVGSLHAREEDENGHPKCDKGQSCECCQSDWCWGYHNRATVCNPGNHSCSTHHPGTSCHYPPPS